MYGLISLLWVTVFRKHSDVTIVAFYYHWAFNVASKESHGGPSSLETRVQDNHDCIHENDSAQRPPKTSRIQSKRFYLNTQFKSAVMLRGWCICCYVSPSRSLFHNVGRTRAAAWTFVTRPQSSTSPQGSKISLKISNVVHADELEGRMKEREWSWIWSTLPDESLWSWYRWSACAMRILSQSED